MKSFIPILAFAAGVSATFRHAPPFTCPGNTDNKCTDKQRPGFNWDDLDIGDFFDYGDFNFQGWSCQNGGGGGGRGRFAPRTGQKVIGGTCSSEKHNSPSFGCGPSIDRFSLSSIHVKPEFDCDLEFHYDMPDGSTCKHRSACKSSGTTVVNNQCGGAKNVTVVFPHQPDKPKPSCSIQVPTISFDCSTASSTKPPKTTTAEASTTISPPPVEATTTTEVKETTTTSPPPVEETTTTKTPPAEGTTTTTPPPAEETTTASPPPAGESSTSTSSPEQQTSDTSAVVVPPPVTRTIITSYDSTSTVFTTSTATVTSCAPEVPDCPGDSVVTTVVTIAVSTTICPVTETRTTIESTTSVEKPPSKTTTTEKKPGSSEAASSSSSGAEVPPTTSTTVRGPGSPGGPGSSAGATTTALSPVETLPCPGVVPSCLNTFMFTVGCKDNTDAACYCPDATFVKTVFNCLYAHGETDEIIAEAVAYFQGICGKWIGSNPGIATDATVTTYITVTAAPTVAPVYTTIVVDVTTVVPCTDDNGQEIPSSSTTVTVNTSVTVPQVGFTTGTSDEVGVGPVTGAPTDGPGATGSAATTAASATGTGGYFPSGTTTGSVPIPTAGVGRVGASFGLVVAAVAAVVVL
ncbi:uncharacterized protein C8A04DRAFT_26468 [Dichotomopilus funicola]|uniref:CFEM domain-containing protein n=1 Tax=Dichotomopilus funicola TaxID=1934379 RepID=A0AAN6V6E3_9PEZI|nr:hypothetical protein C8A04DRAFT_26468 [Dichotomopilus funicola]